MSSIVPEERFSVDVVVKRGEEMNDGSFVTRESFARRITHSDSAADNLQKELQIQSIKFAVKFENS